MKSEVPLDESKPVIKELVAFAPFTPQKGVALPAVSCSLALDLYRTISASCYIFIDKV
jgi:hypothetical protein